MATIASLLVVCPVEQLGSKSGSELVQRVTFLGPVLVEVCQQHLRGVPRQQQPFHLLSALGKELRTFEYGHPSHLRRMDKFLLAVCARKLLLDQGMELLERVGA